MKKILIPMLVACVLALPVHAQSILVIDVNGVFNNLTEVKGEIDKMKVVVGQYNDYLSQQAKEITDLQGKVNVLQQETENQALTQEARAGLTKELGDQSADLDSKRQEFVRDQQLSSNIVQNAQQKLIQLELGKIRDQVAIVAAKRKASLVLNKSDIGLVSSVLYSDKAFDISDDVQDALNKAAQTSNDTSALPQMPPPPSATAAPASSAKPAAATGTAH